MLQIHWEATESERLLRLVGELAIESVEAFEASTRALEPGELKVVLDCQELLFIDSTGTNALLMTALRWRREGRMVAIVNLNEEIQEMLDLLGFFEVLAAAN